MGKAAIGEPVFDHSFCSEFNQSPHIIAFTGWANIDFDDSYSIHHEEAGVAHWNLKLICGDVWSNFPKENHSVLALGAGNWNNEGSLDCRPGIKSFS